MDWTTLTAALVGGLIGISAEFIGRRNARKDAERQRKIELEDRASTHEREKRLSLEVEKRTTTRVALDSIIKATDENRIPRIDYPGRELDDKEVILRTESLMSALYNNIPYITDNTLRARVADCQEILDMAITPGTEFSIPLREVVFVVRNRLYSWIGSWLRGDALPELDQDFILLLQTTSAAVARLEELLADRGDAFRRYPEI